MTQPTPTMYTTNEVAHLFYVSPKTVTRWANNGKLGHVIRTPGGHRRYSAATINRMLEPPNPEGAA